jgi:hypothetical protein
MAEDTLKIYFTPNPDEGSLLGGTPEPSIEVNKEVITDNLVAKCHCSARTLLVEYGEYKNEPACLLGFEFVFHAYLTRYKHAKIDVEFTRTESTDPKLNIVLLFPHQVKGQVSEEVVKKALSGEVTIGYEPYASITGHISEEKEGVKKSYMTLKGSRVGIDTVRWTLEENAYQKDGIPMRFVGFVVISGSGPFSAEFDVDATIGKYQTAVGAAGGMIDYIRQLVSREPANDSNNVAFDSKTPIDRREDLTKSSFKIEGWAPAAGVSP